MATAARGQLQFGVLDIRSPRRGVSLSNLSALLCGQLEIR